MAALSPRRFAALCLLAYVALAWAARFDMRLGQQIASLVYPLDTFSMYSSMPEQDRSFVLVRDRQGGVHRVTDFRAFACDAPLTGPAARCTAQRGIPYLHEGVVRHIERHAGPGDEEVELITRTWTFEPGEPIATADCVVARCRVAR